MTGTWVNIGAVLIGSCIGLAFGSRMPETIRRSIMCGLGLCTLVIGVSMALETRNFVVVIASVVIGAALGEALRLEKRLEAAAESLKRSVKSGSPTFAEGFVTASLVFCAGPMTIVGSMREGLSGDAQLLLVKSMMDGFASMAFAAALGPGVIFSACGSGGHHAWSGGASAGVFGRCDQGIRSGRRRDHPRHRADPA